jgi:hypothetical protein
VTEAASFGEDFGQPGSLPHGVLKQPLFVMEKRDKSPTPKGFHNTAQGRSRSGRTLGKRAVTTEDTL